MDKRRIITPRIAQPIQRILLISGDDKFRRQAPASIRIQQYAVCAPVASNMAPVPYPGYAEGEWARWRVIVQCSWQKALLIIHWTKIDIGIGYGPVPINRR